MRSSDSPLDASRKGPFIGTFDNTYSRLPEEFYERILPTAVAAPQLIEFNQELGENLGLNFNTLKSEDLAQIFAGNLIPQGATPIALAYAGHQFAHFVPQLGDGRALLLGEVIAKNGRRYDIQLKGSGPTRFSRRGDGRSALGPAIREYLVSEAMNALNIPTTRSLALVTTGELVYRGDLQAGGITTRIASSHIRVGSFEYFFAKNDVANLKTLADYAIQRHYPEATQKENSYLAFLQGVVESQAKLIALWMQVGFIHGVMNTDNCSIAGETIDFGPCAFMDAYDPATVFSSIDRQGRYAYSNQAKIAHWNLHSLANCLIPLIDQNPESATSEAQNVLSRFAEHFNHHWLSGMFQKLGLLQEHPENLNFLKEFLDILQQNQADFTLSFRYLSDLLKKNDSSRFFKQFKDSTDISNWIHKWELQLRHQNLDPQIVVKTMDAQNPAFIPRNHQVAEVIRAAEEHQDFSKLKVLLKILSTPFKEQPEFEEFMNAPLPEERVTATFCGT